tara:strand:- start:639 stop:902 length:264 start_codon:yes stop_codon:yes gene_type:complete
MQDDNKNILLSFAQSLESAIGTAETVALLEKVTKFANECPDICLELKELVETTPYLKDKLLTREGVNEFRTMIDIVSNMDIDPTNFF